MATALNKLQHLSLVQKVCSELENHVGINEPDLAEFIIDLAGKYDNVNKFQRELATNGAEFEDSFVSSHRAPCGITTDTPADGGRVSHFSFRIRPFRFSRAESRTSFLTDAMC